MVGVKDVYGDATGIKVIGNNIWHTATGVQIGAGVIASNYIHSMGFKSEQSHAEWLKADQIYQQKWSAK